MCDEELYKEGIDFLAEYSTKKYLDVLASKGANCNFYKEAEMAVINEKKIKYYLRIIKDCIESGKIPKNSLEYVDGKKIVEKYWSIIEEKEMPKTNPFDGFKEEYKNEDTEKLKSLILDFQRIILELKDQEMDSQKFEKLVDELCEVDEEIDDILRTYQFYAQKAGVLR